MPSTIENYGTHWTAAYVGFLWQAEAKFLII